MDIFWQITIVEFLLNLAVFAAAVIAYGPTWTLAARLLPASRFAQGTAVGILFGAATVIVQLLPVHLSGGGFTGSQAILLAMAGLLAGPAAALAAALIAVAVELVPTLLGGTVHSLGIVMSLASAGAGLALRLLLDRRKSVPPGEVSYYHLPLLGALSASLNLLVLWTFQGSAEMLDAIVPAYVSGILAATILGTLLLHETRRHMAEEELRESEARLASQARELFKSRDAANHASRAKSEFLANMSHELRTPLNAIIGFSDILNKQLFGPIDNPKYREYVKDINESGTHLLEIINGILDLAKAEVGRLEPQMEEYDLAKCLDDCMLMCCDRAENGGVRLTLGEIASPVYVLVDRRLIFQAIFNLVTNGIKFTLPG